MTWFFRNNLDGAEVNYAGVVIGAFILCVSYLVWDTWDKWKKKRKA
jgi:hypothetical protein